MSTIKFTIKKGILIGAFFMLLNQHAFSECRLWNIKVSNPISKDSIKNKESFNEHFWYEEAASIGLNPLEATYYVQRAKAAYNGVNISDDYLIKQGPPESLSIYNVNNACDLGFESLNANSFYTTPQTNMIFGEGYNIGGVPHCNTASTPTNGRHTLMYDKQISDPTGIFSIVAPDWEKGVTNTKSIRLGNAFGGGGAESLRLVYDINNSLPSKIIYSYAVVLQDPSHSASDNPFFELKTYIEGNAPSACASFKIIAGQGKSGYSYTENKTALYKKWTTNIINIAELPGYNFNPSNPQKLVLEFTTADCTLGAHYGYAYIDLNCTEPLIVRKGQSCLGDLSTFESALIGNNKKEDVKWTFKDNGVPFLELTGTITINQDGVKQIVSNSPNVLQQSYQDLAKYLIDSKSNIEAPKIVFDNFTVPALLEVDLELKLYDENNIVQCVNTASSNFTLRNCLPSIIKCKDCITSFAPIPGNKYIISAWAREDVENALGYSKPTIGIVLNGVSKSFQFKPSGKVIDGWQKIESEFDVPEGTYSIDVELYNDDANSSQYVYFDDIRVQPFKSSLKSFVYDAKSQKMVAELDENNYATFYQYDEEGQLVRVKKETERGVMTIKEHNTVKATRQ